jgi:hypothetical protein
MKKDHKSKIQGKCRICNEAYDMQIYKQEYGRYESGYIYQDCPKCGYNPLIEEKILTSLKESVQGIIYLPQMKVEYDYKEIRDRVLEKIVLFWPKSIRSEK